MIWGDERILSEPRVACSEAVVRKIHAGEEKCKPGHSWGPGIRENHLIHVVQSGRGRFFLNGIEYPVEAGQLFFIPPGVMAYYEADRDDPWEYKWAGFIGEHLDEIFVRGGLTGQTPVMEVTGKITGALDAFVYAYEKGTHAKLLLTCRAYELLHALSGDGWETENVTHGQRYVNSVKEYIWRFMYKKITVSQLAQYTGVDRSYLTGVFKRYTGLSLQQYILDTKMTAACRYLKTTDYNVSQIAESLGYEDLFVFSHAFKKYAGVSPQNYRKNNPTLP